MSKRPRLKRILRRNLHRALWKLGIRTLPDRPSTLMIEPSNVCNLKCPTCPTGAGTLNRPPRDMSFDEFKSILDQALDPPGYLKRVTLYNYGEPFLCKDFLKMVRYAAERGLETFTSTNGLFFRSDEAAAAVVESGLTELIVCLDGADQETLNRYRKNADFEAVVEGVRRVVRARKALGKDRPLVELQFLLMRHNEHQIGRIREIARELGADRFVEKTVSINPADPDFQKLAAEILPEDLSKSRYMRMPDGKIAVAGEPPSGCEYMNSAMVVNSNGDVVPCCYDMRSEHVMGNVLREPLGAVWRGEKFQAFRKKVAESRAAVGICRFCPEGRVVMRKVDEV